MLPVVAGITLAILIFVFVTIDNRPPDSPPLLIDNIDDLFRDPREWVLEAELAVEKEIADKASALAIRYGYIMTANERRKLAGFQPVTHREKENNND